jgi:hypothetical protein
MDIRRLNNGWLKNIIENNGLTITAEEAQAELNRRANAFSSKFKPFENKKFIKKRDDYISIYVTKEYDPKEYGMPYHHYCLSISRNNDDENVIDGFASINSSWSVVDERDIEDMFENMEEMRDDVEFSNLTTFINRMYSIIAKTIKESK